MPRSRIYVHPFEEIEIFVTDDPVQDKNGDDLKDKNGNVIYNRPCSISLDKILDAVKKAGIKESEYNNIRCEAGYETRCDTLLFFTYRRPKTQKEIDDETVLKQQKIDEKDREKAQRKEEKDRQKAEKQKVLDSLSVEQKKALGIK